VAIDSKYYRPSEIELLVDDASKAKKTVEWEPKTTFKDLVSLMVDVDMSALKRQGILRR
jgi:GDPmannose 4,6-dehydratase